MELKSEGESIQSLVDALSISLQRSVLLDDPTLVPIAYSRQWDVDAVRSDSILGRGPDPRVREELFSQGIRTARDVVHVEPNASLGMEGRACFPVHQEDELLGFLWVLDPRWDLSDSESARLIEAARNLARLLMARPLRDVPDETRLIGELRSPEADVRVAAAAEARERGLVGEDRVILCLVATAGAADEGEALEWARKSARRLSVGQAIAAGAPEGAALIVSLADPVLRALSSDHVADWLLAGADPVLIAAQSEAFPLDSLHEASRQAVIALRVARLWPRSGPRSWPTLGADRLISQLSNNVAHDVPERLASFINGDSQLVETLYTFLECAGDVKATSEALSLHRSGLYYRLSRIEDQAGIDLSKGDDRLLAHISLRLLKGPLN